MYGLFTIAGGIILAIFILANLEFISKFLLYGGVISLGILAFVILRDDDSQFSTTVKTIYLIAGSFFVIRWFYREFMKGYRGY